MSIVCFKLPIMSLYALTQEIQYLITSTKLARYGGNPGWNKR
jgi:cytochrome c-type biogenesis protein CcmE